MTNKPFAGGVSTNANTLPLPTAEKVRALKIKNSVKYNVLKKLYNVLTQKKKCY